MMSTTRSDVSVLRWPDQRKRRDWCREQRLPRLLVVEGGCAPPLITDALEDWARHPLSQVDLDARLATLARRHARDSRPRVEADGALVYRGARVSPSPCQLALLRPLLAGNGAGRGEPVPRAELARSLGIPPEVEGERRNLLDLHVARLRRRVAPLGLTVRAVARGGYALEEVEPAWASSTR